MIKIMITIKIKIKITMFNNNKNNNNHHHHHHSYKFTTEALETLPWPPEGIRQRWPSVRTRSDLGGKTAIPVI
jgi:hypothetical protein